MRKLLACGLVVAGVLLLAYPKAGEWFDNRQQEKLLAQWEASAMNEEAAWEAREQYDGLTNLFAEAEDDGDGAETGEPPSDAADGDATGASEAELESEAASAPPATQPPALEAIATIRIPGINLKLPVLEGATQQNMKYAAAHLKETTPLGEVGNAAIAAHRMRAKGRLFNRLNEVKVGDKIVIETKGETFTYTVYKVSIVEPTDVSVLNYNNKDKRLTLITCDPVVNPTHRLIVHAEME